MSQHHPDEAPGLDGPDYVTLVIEWDVLAGDLEREVLAVAAVATTRDADWQIDEAGRESFPASDPPAWGSSHASPSAETIERMDEPGHEATAPPARPRRTALVLGVLTVLAIVTGLAVGLALVHHHRAPTLALLLR